MLCFGSVQSKDDRERERSRRSRDKNEDDGGREKTGDERHRSKDRHHDKSKENDDNKDTERDQKQVTARWVTCFCSCPFWAMEQFTASHRC